MGIYLGQLPPAEIARLKAELAETIIANFCYPRFFDYRTNSLRMRPVDRTKRQEVWLYLSSVDFTAWNRVDLMSPDLQRYIERLFIQFVQRNRNFFGQQGRKRMPDVRTLITVSSTSVVQGLRNHVTGRKSEGQLSFGSPRPVSSWGVMGAGGHTDVGWEQIAAMSAMLQQQLQEIRSEVKSSSENRSSDGRSPQSTETSTPSKSSSRPMPQRSEEATKVQGKSTPVPPDAKQTARSTTPSGPLAPQPTAPVSPMPPSQPARVLSTPVAPAASVAGTRTANGVVKKQEVVVPTTSSQNGEAFLASQQTVISPVAPPPPLSTVAGSTIAKTSTQPVSPTQTQSLEERNGNSTQHVQPTTSSAPMASSVHYASSAPMASSVHYASSVASSDATIEPYEHRDGSQMLIGEDDIAIFEQMRHQMMLWLRIEAIHAGIELTGQGPSQLLDVLRRQERFDETRLQVVSTLLNLSNQVIKTRHVSILDYKQALMFHLMHTRR